MISAEPSEETSATRIFLLCGIAASVLYIAMNTFIPLLYPGYSFFSQAPSELSAVGAPTRNLWRWFGWLYTLLTVAFGLGVLRSADRNKYLRICGALLLAYGLVMPLWELAPMHMREELSKGKGNWQDIMHIVMAAVSVGFMFISMSFGAAAFGNRFRVYTVITIVLLLVFGALTGTLADELGANLPTPWLGVWERISIAAFLLWVIVLALILLRVRDTTELLKPNLR
jgi:hypothetical protein